MLRRKAGAAALAGLLALLAITASAHEGHPQKKLLPYTWYQQVNGDYASWMTLSTSDIVLKCDEECGSRWQDPFAASIEDWNAQPTTVFLSYQDGVQNLAFDVNVIVQDVVAGNPALFGLARFFDVSYRECFFSCEVWFGWAMIGDDAHSGYWGTSRQRQGTISHEIGHLLGLAHESAAGGSGYFPCGYDETGPIPHSIMAYNCIDPPLPRGGLEEVNVAPFDVCGINHKFPDPNWGYAGCEELASRDPPEQRGDLDCDGDIDSVDSLRALRFAAGLDTGVPAACAPIGAYALSRSGFAGDIDCDNDADSADALAILRHVAGFGQTTPAFCPAPQA